MAELDLEPADRIVALSGSPRPADGHVHLRHTSLHTNVSVTPSQHTILDHAFLKPLLSHHSLSIKMRVAATLLAVLPLAFAAPSTDPRSIPELSVNEWSSIQSTFVDRVWNGLTGWSWNKAEELVGLNRGDEGKTVYQQLKADEQYSKLVKAIEVGWTIS